MNGKGAFVPTSDPAEVALELRLLGEQVCSRELGRIAGELLEKKLPRLLRDAGTDEPYTVIGYTLGLNLSRRQLVTDCESPKLTAQPKLERRYSVLGLDCRVIAHNTLELMQLANDDSPIEELEGKILEMAQILCDPLTAKRPFIVSLRGHEAQVRKILHKMGVPAHYEETLRKCCAKCMEWSLHELVMAMKSVKRISKLAQQAKTLMFPRPAEAKQRLKQFKKILLELAATVLPDDYTEHCSETTDMSTFSPMSCTSSTVSNLSANEYSNAEKQVTVYFGRFDYEGEGLLCDKEDIEMLITSLCVKLSIDMNLDDLPRVMPNEDETPARGWTVELFRNWFMNKFFADDLSECYSSPTTTPLATPRALSDIEEEEGDIEEDVDDEEDEADGEQSLAIVGVGLEDLMEI